MTGSAINSGRDTILTGNVLAEDEMGNVRLADENNPPFAIATAGAPSGSIVTYADEGIIERDDWSSIVGAKGLAVGKKYYLAIQGKISTQGSQQVGVARSHTALRVSIQQVGVPTSAIWPLTSPPKASLGKEKDFALDQNTLAVYLKLSNGWQLLGYLVKTFDRAFAPINVFNDGVTGWSFTPTS